MILSTKGFHRAKRAEEKGVFEMCVNLCLMCLKVADITYTSVHKRKNKMNIDFPSNPVYITVFWLHLLLSNSHELNLDQKSFSSFLFTALLLTDTTTAHLFLVYHGIK